MNGDPPAHGEPHRSRQRDPPPSAPPSISNISNVSRRRPREQQSHHAPSKKSSPRSQYLLDSTNNCNGTLPQFFPVPQQNYNQTRPPSFNTPVYNGRDRQPTLRRRGSSLSSIDRSSDERPHHRHRHEQHNGRDDIRTKENTATRRVHHHSTTTQTKSASSLSRMLTLVILFILILWCCFRGIEATIGLTRGAANIIFGRRRRQDSSPDMQLEVVEPDNDSIYSEKHDVGLRGSSETHDNESPKLSIHDLNARSHLLKYEGRQLINDKGLEEDEEGSGDKAYMGKDSTNDFFYAGSVAETKRIVNTRGKIETISFPARSYALLPFSLNSKPFALSIWIYLAPMEKNKKDGGFEDSRRPRVILSTRASDNQEGCRSDVFGENLTTGLVLYAQPHYGDDSSAQGGGETAKTYRVILEYTRAGTKNCRHIVGSNQNAHVEEGEWHHIVLFATKSDTQGHERISLYVNGDIAGREAYESRQLSTSSESKTAIGRYATQVGSKIESSGNNFDLGGRIGMLSFWETASYDAQISKTSNQMKIQSESDEDHVVRAINRAAFDIRAIKELGLQGLTVKEPTLLYTFDGQKKSQVNDLYSDSPRVVNEVMSRRTGTVMMELADGMHAHQRQAFIPFGGNRYMEYKDGNFVPPALSAAERKELDEVARARSGVVKKSMQHVWSGYKKYAYGKDELLPLSNGGQDNWGGMGTTLVDSLSTLWLMDMKNEFYDARDWVRDNLNFGQVKESVSVFETTIRNLGGLLSAYDLSGDEVFLKKADDLGMRLMRSFDSKTGIPYGQVELFDGGQSYNTGWHSNEAVLSEIGTLQVEFRYLAKATGKNEYAINVMRALDELLKLDPESGLYPTFIHNTKQELSFGNSDITLGAMGDSFYEYLLKIWLQSGKKEMKYRRLYDKSVDGIMEKLIHMSRPSYLTYVAEVKRGTVVHKMDHLSCFLGGNLALGAYTHPDGLESKIAQRQLKTGKQLAYTCYQMYARSKSGLSPEYVKFNSAKSDFVKGHAPYYILRPETAETFFILHHLTKDPVYREWGWEIFQAIEEHCKTDAGYAAIRDVDTMKKDDRMESFFLAETLKYLYLLQDDTHEIDLLKTHVFNTEAHPLRLLNLVQESF